MHRKRKKAILVLTLFAIIGMVACSRMPPKEAELSTGQVAIPVYTGRTVQAAAATEVDEAYMEDLKQRSLELYNQIKGTSYEDWTDELVETTTDGRFRTEEAWTTYMQEGYQKVEKEAASQETAWKVFEQILSETKLLQYEKEDYTLAEKKLIEQCVYGNGYFSLEEYLEDCGITEEELKKELREDVLESLKSQYAIEAIAQAEGLIPTAEEMEGYKEEHMEGVVEMGYRKSDPYYQEELEHYEKEEPWYRLNLMTENVLDFLYQNSIVEE